MQMWQIMSQMAKVKITTAIGPIDVHQSMRHYADRCSLGIRLTGYPENSENAPRDRIYLMPYNALEDMLHYIREKLRQTVVMDVRYSRLSNLSLITFRNKDNEDTHYRFFFINVEGSQYLEFETNADRSLSMVKPLTAQIFENILRYADTSEEAITPSGFNGMITENGQDTITYTIEC